MLGAAQLAVAPPSPPPAGQMAQCLCLPQTVGARTETGALNGSWGQTRGLDFSEAWILRTKGGHTNPARPHLHVAATGVQGMVSFAAGG